MTRSNNTLRLKQAMLKHSPQERLIVVGVVNNPAGEILLCKKPADRGVFPGQWGLPGGGIEAGERIEEALRRELGEELGVQVDNVEALFFSEGSYPKHYPDGTQIDVNMIFLIFSCRARRTLLTLNQEFSEYAWVHREALSDYDLNVATVKTFKRMGLLEG